MLRDSSPGGRAAQRGGWSTWPASSSVTWPSGPPRVSRHTRIYQLSPLKGICLSRCRTPLASLLHYASWSLPGRDVRVGLAHGAYCTACCWALMAAMAGTAAMDLRLTAALTDAVLLEKSWRHGGWLSGAIGVGLLALAPIVAFVGVSAAPMT